MNYPLIFGEDYRKAVDYCSQNQEVFQQKAELYNLPATELKAIIFPELIRHSSFKDFFETTALEMLYTNGGVDYADFSIGHFQMKPSFVEKLEATIQNDKHLASRFPSIIDYTTFDAKTNRKIRLQRLKNEKWQVKYLCCFYVIVSQKFEKELKGLTIEKRIKSLATAYNYGFNKSWENIEKWSRKACFPFGAKYPENQQHVYANVAWYFYQKNNL